MRGSVRCKGTLPAGYEKGSWIERAGAMNHRGRFIGVLLCLSLTLGALSMAAAPPEQKEAERTGGGLFTRSEPAATNFRFITAIEAETGRPLSKTTIYHLDPTAGRQLVPEAKFNMEGTTSDVLSGDGDSVFLKYFTFDREGKRTETTKPHLFSITGFLGEEWFVRNYWILGEGMPGAGWGGWANAANTFPSGRLLCINNDSVYGYGRTGISAGPTGHKADAYHLFAMDRTPVPPSRRTKRETAKSSPKWEDTHSLIVRAMVLGNDHLVVAGPPDLGQKEQDLLAFKNESEALAGFDGEKGVYLRIVGATNGKELSECALPAMPVFDGMAAANGRLYLS